MSFDQKRKPLNRSGEIASPVAGPNPVGFSSTPGFPHRHGIPGGEIGKSFGNSDFPGLTSARFWGLLPVGRFSRRAV